MKPKKEVTQKIIKSINLKLLSPDGRGATHLARKDVFYSVGKETTAPDWNPGGHTGLYFAELLTDYMPEAKPFMHLVKVVPIGRTVRHKDADTVRAEKLMIVNEVKVIPTPTEEPSWENRLRIARFIPPEYIGPCIPRPCDEPNNLVRLEIAKRIPEDLISRVPSVWEEPVAEIRREYAQRIYKEKLRLVPASEEPSWLTRCWVAHRIPLMTTFWLNLHEREIANEEKDELVRQIYFQRGFIQYQVS